MAGETSVRNNNLNTNMGVSSGGEVGVNKVESQKEMAEFKSYDFCLVHKAGL